MARELEDCVTAVQKLLKAFKAFGDKKHKVLHLLTLVYVSMALTKKSFVDNRQQELFDKSLVWDGLNEDENENFHHILQDMLQTLLTDNSVLCNLNEQLQFDCLSSNQLIALLATIKRLLADGASSEEQIRLIVDVAINEIDARILPEEIIQLLLSMVDYQQGQLVYDPKSGSGTLISSLIKHFNDVQSLQDLNNIHARESESLDAKISALVAELLSNESLKFNANLSFDVVKTGFPRPSFYDVILTYPKAKKGRNPLMFDTDYRATLLIGHIFDSLKHDGAAAVMISELILDQSSKAELSYLIQSSIGSNFLDAVLRLPRRIFNDEPHVVIVFKKFKTDRTAYFFDSSMSLRSDLKLDLSDILQGINNRETLPGRAYLAGYEEVIERGSLIVSKYLKRHSPYTSTPEEYENIEIQKKQISERSERINKLSQSTFK